MMEKEDHIALFDNYQNGKLSESERAFFQSRFETDEEFKSEYETYLEAALLLESHGVQEEIKKIIIHEPKRQTRRLVWAPVSIAASLTILMVSYWVMRPSQNAQQLFQSYYQPYPDLTASRSTSDSKGIISMAMAAYSKKDYLLALKNFEKIDPLNDTLRFYISLSYLSLNQPDNALTYLEDIPKQSVFRQQVSWYKALSLLSKGEVKNGRIVLESIEPYEFNYLKAKEVLNELSE